MGVADNASYCGTTCSERQSFQAHRSTYKRADSWQERDPHMDTHDASLRGLPIETCQLCH